MKNNADLTIKRMKMLMEMIEESYEESKNPSFFVVSSYSSGSVKHLACELGKLCSKVRKEV
jgi:hypothetical protein